MTVRELLEHCHQDAAHFQRHVNAFVDAFRRAPAENRAASIADGPRAAGRFEGLAAAVVSALCREVAMPVPDWVARTRSPEPFFVFPAKGFPLRLRLMLESPPPFRARDVFVPDDYLARA